MVSPKGLVVFLSSSGFVLNCLVLAVKSDNFSTTVAMNSADKLYSTTNVY